MNLLELILSLVGKFDSKYSIILYLRKIGAAHTVHDYIIECFDNKGNLINIRGKPMEVLQKRN